MKNTTAKFSVDAYPAGANAFTAYKVLASNQPVPGKRRKLAPIDSTLPEDVRRAIKNERNRELVAAKRASLRVNKPSNFNCPINPRNVAYSSALQRARAAI